MIPNIGQILIVVDAMTGWPEAFVCKDRSSTTIRRILQSVFGRFGVPIQVVSDNAQEFISDELVTWLERVGATTICTPHYHPASNGLVERMVQTIKRSLQIWSIEKGDFHGFLQKVLLTYRTSSIAASRNGTPSMLMFDVKSDIH